MNSETSRKRKSPEETDAATDSSAPQTAAKKPRAKTPKLNTKPRKTAPKSTPKPTTRGRKGKVEQEEMASGNVGTPETMSTDEGIPTPEGANAQFAAILAKLTTVDSKLDKQAADFQAELVRQGNAFRDEVTRVQQRMDTTADTLTRSVGAINERVLRLETGGGREKALLEEINSANRKLFLRTQGPCTLERFNAKLTEAQSSQAIGWKAFPAKDGWHMFSVVFNNMEDRERAFFDSTDAMKTLQAAGKKSLLKRETPPSYKKAVDSLNKIQATQKAASATMEGNEVKFTISSKIIYVGTKAVLKIKKKGTNLWTTVAEREADEPERPSPEGETANFLVDLSKTVLFHGEFGEGQLLSLLEQATERDGAGLGIVEIVQGAKCSKVICASKDEAAALAAFTKNKPIPGQQNGRFSCTFLP